MKTWKMFLGSVGFGGAVSLMALNLAAQSAAGSGSPASDARAKELQSRYMTAVKTQLTSRLDTKSAVVGQPLTLKTEAAATLADGTVIPVGTKLVGRVIAVHAKTEEAAGSMVVVTFDTAELNDGKRIPVRSMIRTVSTIKPVAPTRGDPMVGVGVANNDPMVGGPIGPQTQSGNIGRGRGTNNGGVISPGGGGSTGGVGGVTRGGLPTTMGNIPSPEPVDPVQRTAPGGETIGNAPRPTGLPGVMLSTNPTTDISGTLMGNGQNIKLDSGTEITLGVILR